MSLFDFFRPKKAQKALNPNQQVVRPIGGVLTPLPLNFQQDRVYDSLSAVYTVVTYLMNKFSTVPIRVYKVEDEAAFKQYKSLQPHQFQKPSNFLKVRTLQRKALSQVDESNPLAKLLQQPNHRMSSDLFFSMLFGFKLLKGEGFVWANRGDNAEGNINAEILELYPIPPQIMHLQPDPNDVYGIDQWVMQLPQYRTVPKEDILLWHYPRFDFDSTTHIHLRGHSPLLSAQEDLEGIAALNASWKSMYLNRGANGVIATQDPNASGGEIKKAMNAINERVNGSNNAGTIGYINALNPVFFDLAMGARDMQLIEAKKFSVTQVAQLYNVPAGIFDLSESANNNITQYRAQVYTDKIMCEWSGLLNQLNTWLLPAFGIRGAYIDADYSEVPDLQADMQRLVEGIKDAWEITPNEKRELRGYDRSTDPLMDTYWVPSTLKPIEDASINIDNLPAQDYDNPKLQAV